MKQRILSVFMILAMLLSLSACKGKPSKEGSEAQVSAPSAPTEEAAEPDSEKEAEQAAKEKAEQEKILKSLKYYEQKGEVWGEKKGIAQEEYGFDEVDETFYGNATFNPKTQTLTVSAKGVVNCLYDFKNWGWWSEEKRVIKKLIIEEGVTEIWNSFDNMMALETIEFPKSLEKIYNSFEYLRKVEKLVIPATVKEISGNSFYGSGFSSLDFEGPINLNSNAFDGLTRLELVVIPEGSTCEQVFRYCDNLKEVVIEKNVVLKNWVYYEENCDPQIEENFIRFVHGEGESVVHYPKAYLHLPTDGKELPWGEGGKYAPIIVPEGQSWQDYRNSPMKLKPKE